MNFCIKREFSEENKEKAKIPRPPNAFMLYANENRKKMSQLYPTESNKDISKRLGNGWKCLEEDEKKKFFDKAKAIGLQHKKEYPDYVYNPKEARIRKAMRDATRERSIGTSPMLQRPNARRVSSSHSWVPPPPTHDDLMMSPMGNMQPCGFPMSSSAGNSEQFLGAMNAYNKMETAPPMPPSSTSVHTNYMQSNPLAQLQQHAEMWPDYQTMRPRSSGNPFMMGDVPSYPSQTPEMGNSLMMEKEPTPATSPPTNEPEPDKEQEQEHFIPVFETTDESKLKKSPGVPQLQSPPKKPTTKSLPDFNEAFGSTERGRFQSPPDPRLAPNKGYLDYFFDSAPIKFDDYQI